MTEGKTVLYKRRRELEREISVRNDKKANLEKELNSVNSQILYREGLLEEILNAEKTLSLMIEKEK